MTTNKLRWGIIGTGGIARRLAEAIGQSRTGTLVGVGSRRQETADAFGDEFGIPNRFASYDGLIDDPEVDVVYNSLPNHLHAEWTIRCAVAGKHILCEKPLATNLPQTEAMIQAVRDRDVFLMEAFMYRCHPQIARMVELIRDGAIGEVRIIQAEFAYDQGVRLDNIRQQNESAGGGIMDVGCYTLSMARLVAGAATGQEVAEPVELHGCAHIGPQSRVDEWATATLRFPGDILANLACGSRCAMKHGTRVWGSDGHLELPNPWFAQDGRILLTRKGADTETITVPSELPLYATEVDTVASHLDARQAPAPCMTWADSLGQQRALDRWRESVGLVFDEERQE